MERDQLTFLVITDPARPAHTLQLSQRKLRFLLAGISSLFLFILFAAAALVMKLGDIAEAESLRQQNSILAADLGRMQETVDQLTQSLATISEHDRRFRLLAGLRDIDPEVRQVGIGGPGTSSLESEPLLDLDPALGAEVFNTTADLNRLLRQANLLKVSFGEASRRVEENREDWARYPSIDPADGWLSSTFSHSRWHPLLNVRRPHEGVDISAPRGTPVVATADGTVTFAGWRPGFGWTVEIDHGNGVKTRYAHNDKSLKVEVGTEVRRGDIIALVGASGLAKGPHVHYEVLLNGQAVDPDNYRLNEVIFE